MREQVKRSDIAIVIAKGIRKIILLLKTVLHHQSYLSLKPPVAVNERHGLVLVPMMMTTVEAIIIIIISTMTWVLPTCIRRTTMLELNMKK